jgi:peptide/nickel transport system substrate-binding protein
MDPQLTQSINHVFYDAVYNGLVRLELEDSETGEFKIVGSLAESWEQPDAKTIIFNLRQGVKFHDGSDFDAEVAKWNFERQRDHPKSQRKSSLAFIESVDALDSHTLQITSQKDNAALLGTLAFGAAGLVHIGSKAAFDELGEDGIARHGVGTGPFRVKEWITDDRIVLERNPDYWEMGADGKPLPYLDEVTKVSFGDVAAELAAMRAGQLAHPGTFGFRPDMLKILRDSDLNLTFYDILPPIHGSVWFDNTVAPWNDVRVRQAVLKSIDREALIISLQGGVVHSGYVPGAFTDVAWPEAKLIEKFSQDLEGAKKLLAESGYKSGGTASKMITTGQYAQEAEVVQNFMKQIGLNVEIEVSPNRSWGGTMRKLNWELGWGVAGGSVAEFPVYYLCELHTDNPLNTTRYGDATIDNLCSTQAIELDPVKRKALWDQIQDHLYEVVPTVPTVSTIYGMALACEVKNYKRVHTGRNPSGFVRAWLDKSGC